MGINYEEYEIKYYPWYFFGWVTPISLIIAGFIVFQIGLFVYFAAIAGVLVIGNIAYYMTDNERSVRAIINGVGIMVFMEHTGIEHDTLIKWDSLRSWYFQRKGKNRPSKLHLIGTETDKEIVLKHVKANAMKVMNYYAADKNSKPEKPFFVIFRYAFSTCWFIFLIFLFKDHIKDIWEFIQNNFSSMFGR